MTERSLYVFSGGYIAQEDRAEFIRNTPETLVKVDGIRCAATLAHPTYGLFVGGWEDSDWLERIRPLLEFPIVLVEEAEPIPDYPPSWPTRIVHRKPSDLAYHAFSVEATLPGSPWVEEASVTIDGDVLVLFGAERASDISAMATNPIFVTSFAYDLSEALV